MTHKNRTSFTSVPGIPHCAHESGVVPGIKRTEPAAEPVDGHHPARGAYLTEPDDLTVGEIGDNGQFAPHNYRPGDDPRYDEV